MFFKPRLALKKLAIIIFMVNTAFVLVSCQGGNIKIIITVNKNDITKANREDTATDMTITNPFIKNKEEDANTKQDIEAAVEITTNNDEINSEINLSEEKCKQETSQALQRVPVLLYHDILPDSVNVFGNNAFIVSSENFEKQIQILKENGYNAITLNQLKAYVKGELNLNGKYVLITFDDGYKSDFLYAYPILKKYSMHGVIFVVSGWIKEYDEPFNSQKLQILSWNDIKSGIDVFEYASHTHTLHHRDEKFKSILVSSNDEIVYNDLLKSMETLCTKCIAYPYGEYSEKTLDIVKELGYEMGFTIENGFISPGDDIYRLKRNAIYRNTSLDEFKKIIGLTE